MPDNTNQIDEIINDINELLNKLPKDLPLEIVDEEGNKAWLHLKSLEYDANDNIVKVWSEATN